MSVSTHFIVGGEKMFKSFLIKYAEIGVKGKNRYIFENALVDNAKRALDKIDGDFSVTKENGRIYAIANAEYDFDEAVNALQHVFGIVGICPMVQIEDNGFEDLAQQVIKYIDETYPEKNFTFKVMARRARKNYPMNSMELNAELGGKILEAFEGLKVDVHNPDIEINVEIRNHINIYSMIIPGPGGMPVGTAGKAMLLLSGGIDSPVAGHMISKRGVEIDAVNFFSFPYTSERAKEKVIELASIIAQYTSKINLYIVPFTEIQLQIAEKCPEEHLTLVMRRFMMRIAERLARKHKSLALVTGESVGQVASQTLAALDVTNSAVDMPVLQPLIGMDKIEIVDRAHEIGTFETSILPYEDCCTVFTPKHPTTNPKRANIEKSENRLDVETLIEAALAGVEKIEVYPK